MNWIKSCYILRCYILRQKVVTFRFKKLLLFASKVVTFRVDVTLCVNCYILRRNTHNHHHPFIISTVWSTRQFRPFLNLKDKIKHVSNMVLLSRHWCKTCKAKYVRIILVIFEVRRLEHEDQSYKYEPARHIDRNKDRQLNYGTITLAMHWRTRKFCSIKCI